MKKLLFIHVLIICLSFVAKANNPHKTPPKTIYSNKYLQTLTPPKFPGGEEALHNYINQNLKWPPSKGETPQNFLMSFFVEKDGRLTGLKVEKSLSPEFDAQVIKLVVNSPRWIPATQNNQPIKSKYSLPIRYQSFNEKVLDN